MISSSALTARSQYFSNLFKELSVSLNFPILIADKIQNRKDFELYHLGKHERSDELDSYFKNWLERLNISEEFYQETKNELCKFMKS